MLHTFPTTGPLTVYVEVQSGSIELHAADVEETTVDVRGEQEEHTVVTMDRDRLVVVTPRRGGLLRPQHSLSVSLAVPRGSSLVTKVGSASVTTSGSLGTARITSGSGPVRVEEAKHLVVTTGSGNIEVAAAGGPTELKTGSGRILLHDAQDRARLVSGSGTVEVGRASASVHLRSGSGDVALGLAEADASLSTGTGQVRIDRMVRGSARVKNANGDISVGIAEGTPVWTDVTTGSGRVVTDLVALGAPAEGQAYVEVRARTSSGDVYLQHV